MSDVAPPAFPLQDLKSIANRHFGLSGDIVKLVSERDQNARLTSDGTSYVLKIAHVCEDPEQLDMQNAVLAHLAATGFEGTPRLCRTLAGDETASVDKDGARHLARVVTWLEGDLLSQAPRTLAQLENLGAFMGQLTGRLQGFGHPASFRPDFVWSLDHVGQVQAWSKDISDPGHRGRVEDLFLRYNTLIAPRLPALRASVLHQDANDNNVIVDPADTDRIAGLIDFGDMAYGRTINELAITLAYAVLDADDIYGAIRAVIKGFTGTFPITEDEAELVYDLMRIRLAASVCISSNQAKKHPDNTYLTISQEPAFQLLDRLASVDPAFMIALCRKAAGYPAIARAPAVRSALAGKAYGPVLFPDLKRTPRMALLVDGTYPDMPLYSDRSFDAWFESRRPKELPSDLPFVGLGPYGEKRDVYTSEQFADPASRERRNRHLGVDIFAPVGTAVHAPLAGTVQSVCYNPAELDYGHTLILRHETEAGEPFFTLYGHLGEDVFRLAKPGQQIRAGDLIGHFGDWHENGGWSPHLHFQVMTDLLSQTGNFFGVGHSSLWDVWSDICIDPNLVLGLPAESYAVDPHPPRELLERREKTLGPSLSVSYRNKLKIVRGKGPWLIDHTGRCFLDAVNNITHVGHCHPHVTEAIARQAAILNTNTRYLSELILDYSERLTKKLPENLDTVFFVNSGSEANELALRIARTAIGRKSTVVLDWAYHGNTGGMVDVSPYKFKRAGGYPKPDFVEIAAFPDPYRGDRKGMSKEAGEAYACDVDRCLASFEAATGSGAAAFIAESVSGVGGQVFYPQGYLAKAYEMVRARGGVCIADEVQCGFGRMGAHFWAFELQGVIPDIVVMGKPIGNGHPLAAVVTTRELAEKFRNGMEYFNSFGGNPVSMAVGMAVLDVIENENLQARAASTGDYLMAGFQALAKDHELIGNVRGKGLFCGLELVRDRRSLAPATSEAVMIVNQLRERGVLISTDGPLENVLKIKPPMVFGKEEADILIGELGDTLRQHCQVF
ncbi:aminotransferase class III-fold pyridoxal phosphate-dependent enzyme [Roseibium sp.]|uniref:aminotransferase class III-fold pyridoxal phosphate-dependent enzyme n=1 Tax=Roseibium sp. TaxID=1936156 RepID=UPI003D0D9415